MYSLTIPQLLFLQQNLPFSYSFAPIDFACSNSLRSITLHSLPKSPLSSKLLQAFQLVYNLLKSPYSVIFRSTTQQDDTLDVIANRLLRNVYQNTAQVYQDINKMISNKYNLYRVSDEVIGMVALFQKKYFKEKANLMPYNEDQIKKVYQSQLTTLIKPRFYEKIELTNSRKVLNLKEIGKRIKELPKDKIKNIKQIIERTDQISVNKSIRLDSLSKECVRALELYLIYQKH